jgi:hypothetical protein
MRWIDTSLEAPQDIVPWQEAPRFVTAHIGRGLGLWSFFGQVFTRERSEVPNY